MADSVHHLGNSFGSIHRRHIRNDHGKDIFFVCMNGDKGLLVSMQLVSVIEETILGGRTYTGGIIQNVLHLLH